MREQNTQGLHAAAWSLARQQHWVVTRRQLLELGFTRKAIEHRLRSGRLHRVHAGIYAVGRPELSRSGSWMAALLACGPHAVLSHASAAALWAIGTEQPGVIEVSVPSNADHRRAHIVVHRRAALAPSDRTRCGVLAVTTPAATIIDLAPRLSADELEAMINEADKRDLVKPDDVRRAAERRAGTPGATIVATVLDRRTFTLTDSRLERLLLRLARRAGLPKPQTGVWVNGFKVDFFWPQLGLLVETDGLRYHRTPAQQARDRVRDQAHAAAGLTGLRFTHAQVAFEPEHVVATLAAVAQRIRGTAA